MNKILSLSKSILLFFIAVFCFTSCSKELQNAVNGTGTSTILEQYFEANVLNQNFLINFATDNGTDITANYTGYTFKMLKTDYYHGPAQATKGVNTYTGTWSSNSDYSKLVITLPNIPTEFVFLNREWRFTKKAFPQMELAPWGTTEPLVLHMIKQ
ncbi:MAG TPA: hypothetical protein VIL78_07280 [Hanamia sp.]